MKKCTSFVKKLRSFSDAHADSLIKDIRTLRLTKYISEAVPAICEVTLKVADLHGAAMVCSHLHQRYKEFSNKDTGLVATLLKDFEDRGEGSADPAKRRSTLRFLNELYLVGIVPSIDPIVELLKSLVAEDEKTREFLNLSLIREYAKVAGIDLLGIKARDLTVELVPLDTALEEGDRPIISDEDQEKVGEILGSYHARVSLRLANQYKKMKKKEKSNYEAEMMRGELTEERKFEFEELEKEVDRLMSNVKTLSDVLDLDMPELPEEEEEEVVVSSVSMVGRVEVTASDSPFDDEETRMFYERLQDLRAMVPAIYFSEETTGLKPPEESTDSSVTIAIKV